MITFAAQKNMALIAALLGKTGVLSPDTALSELLMCPDMCLFQIAEAELGAPLRFTLLEFVALASLREVSDSEVSLTLDCEDLRTRVVATWSAATLSWRAASAEL